MSGASELTPRPEQGLAGRSAPMARRVLGELDAYHRGTLVVTRSCPHALATARCGGNDVLTVGDAYDARARLAQGSIRSVVIGHDVEWPNGQTLDLNGRLIPTLRFAPLRTPASHGGEPGEGSIRHETLGDLRVDVGDATSDPSRIDHAALLARVQWLGAWSATPEAQEATALGGRNHVIRGGRALAMARRSIVSFYGHDLTGNGQAATCVADAIEAKTALRSQTFDVVFIHACYMSREDSWENEALRHSIEGAVERGTPILTLCTCGGFAGARSLMGLAVNLTLPSEPHGLAFALNAALAERKAWLHAKGRPSSHLVIEGPQASEN